MALKTHLIDILMKSQSKSVLFGILSITKGQNNTACLLSNQYEHSTSGLFLSGWMNYFWQLLIIEKDMLKTIAYFKS